jgi:hypothetical protein
MRHHGANLRRIDLSDQFVSSFLREARGLIVTITHQKITDVTLFYDEQADHSRNRPRAPAALSTLSANGNSITFVVPYVQAWTFPERAILGAPQRETPSAQPDTCQASEPTPTSANRPEP